MAQKYRRMFQFCLAIIVIGSASLQMFAETFSIFELSREGQQAYQLLLKAEQFEGEVVGYAAAPSRFVIALATLSKEPQADKAFKDLLEKATLPGQLYALCGLYYTDHAFFLTAVEKYRNNRETIKTLFGCIGLGQTVASLVEATAPNVVRLAGPEQTIDDWRKSRPDLKRTGWQIDIIGGGYPASFRDFGQRTFEPRMKIDLGRKTQ